MPAAELACDQVEGCELDVEVVPVEGHRCDNCPAVCAEEELQELKDYFERNPIGEAS